MDENNNNIYSIDTDNVSNDSDNNTDGQTAKIIKVVGVGGGGCNAISHMFNQGIKGISYVVTNTDFQALANSPVPVKLQFGEGLGAGNEPAVAREKAEEAADRIAELFDDETKMVFVTAGMGGGTGTGAGPVVARIAREKNILTVGIVTLPFAFEGQRKIIKAIEGANEMGKYVDALLVINNQRLAEIYKDLSFNNAFAKADDTLTIAARSISELITANGYMNLDFNDVKTTLQNGGAAIISTGFGEGEHRVTKAIEDALNSPLLKNRNVEDSKHILINITFDPDNETNAFKMGETDEIYEFMASFAPDLDVITGISHDKSLGEKVKITLLASGFNASFDKDFTEPRQRSANAQQGGIFDDKSQDNETPKTNVIEDEYGAEYIERIRKAKEKAKFFIFNPEDFDNEELLELFNSQPTFSRTQTERNRFEKVRTTAREKAEETAENVAEIATPAPDANDASSSSTGTVITF